MLTFWQGASVPALFVSSFLGCLFPIQLIGRPQRSPAPHTEIQGDDERKSDEQIHEQSPLLGNDVHCNHGDGTLSNEFLFLGKSFAGGTILGVAFIHMLTPAFANLQSKDVSDITIVGKYEPLAALLSMGGVVFMEILHHAVHVWYEHFFSLSTASARRLLPKRTALLVMEGGLISHSLIVGVSLGVMDSDRFAPVLFALLIHQFLEGWALGNAIAEAEYRTKLASYLFALFYAVSTASGVLIGLLVNDPSNTGSATTRLWQGVFEALSSGILIHTALAEILTPSFFEHHPSFKVSLTLLHYLSLLLGCAVMAVLGVWT